MTRTIILAAGALAAALVAASSLSARGKPETGVMEKEGGAMMSAQAAEQKSPRFAPSEGKKVIFTTLGDAQALAAGGPVVLFFAADWCPTCIAALRDINANGGELGAITVVIVDYDKAGELKSRYGVTSQHTFVQIDSKGTRLAAWNGGGVQDIVKNTVKA